MSLERGVGYGVTGAGIGSAFGPWGTAAGGLLGLGYGLFAPDPAGDAEKGHLRQLEEAQRRYAEYRPQALQARLSAIQNAANMFGPVNNALGRMYGPDAQLNLEGAGVNPFDPGMTGPRDRKRSDPSMNIKAGPAGTPPEGPPMTMPTEWRGRPG